MRTMLVCLLTISAITLAIAGSAVLPMDLLLGDYYLIHRSLAADSTDGISASAARIADISRQAVETEPQANAQLIALSDAAARFQAADLKSARDGFGELSERMIAYLQVAGEKRNLPYQFFCSMVKKNWLQPDKETRNPYYGKSMPKCGELVQSEQPAEEITGHHH